MTRTTEYSEFEKEEYAFLCYEQDAFICKFFVEGIEIITFNLN